MSSPGKWALVAVVLALTLTSLPVAAQGETFAIQLKIGRGEVRYYTTRISLETTFDLGTLKFTVPLQSSAREAARGLGVEDDGTMLMESVLEEWRIGSEEVIDRPLLARIRPDGKVVEVRYGGERETYPFPLPGKPVAVGETWRTEVRQGNWQENMQGTEAYTLSAVESSTEGRVARIKVKTDGRIATSKIEGLPPGAQGSIVGTVKGDGEILWFVDQGRLAVANVETLVDSQLTVSLAGGGTGRGRVALKTVVRREGLPVERVTAPAVEAGFLVVPGKAIGSVLLDWSIANISTALGNPLRITSDWLKAATLQWPEGWRGYVDRENLEKLLGLGVGDYGRRPRDQTYRTEKGVAFGSSEGAVLLTYGLSPVRVDLAIPDVGGVRVLIYNDLGIAFWITSDKTHADRASGHAPIGAVDMVTVFPPGQAGTIFPLP